MQRVTDAWTQLGHEMVQGATAVVHGNQQYTGVCLSVQWHVEEYRDDQWYARAYGAAQQGLRALPPGRLTDRDTRLTFGGISPRIDGETDERYLKISVGTHAPDPLLHHSRTQSILSLSFGTLGMSSGVCEAHPKYLDDTQHTWGETSQPWHWVGALVDNHRLGMR